MSDVFDFDRAAARIGHSMVWLAIAGTLAAWAAAGWRWAGGFLLGAVISWVNYWALRRLVENLGGQRPGRKSIGGIWFAARLILLAGASYVILRFTPISVLAVLIGLFVLIAAVFVEAAYEIYAGKRTLDHPDL
jgi:hypothetical protein